ncbi:MAG TPA: o-succinylbenzoate synthase [Terriglobales bacterium]|nr:o-succinylbenzoate synthase [Terriglobales bacterium]
MRIENITLREIGMRLKAPFETSFGVTHQRRILLVEMIADGVRGWAEITAGEAPFYNAETTDTAWHVVSDFLAPAVIGQKIASAAEVPAFFVGVRGHNMAKAGIENALWDIESQQKRIPLWSLLGGTRDELASGVSLGIRENPQALVAKVQQELECGYQRIKLKIKPGKDIDFVSAVRSRFPNILLSVDANSAYRLEDSDVLRSLDRFDLLMIEQPLEWDDIYSHARLQSQLKTAICLDECINGERHAVAAIESGACRIINMKLGRVGGHSGARKVHEACLARNVPMWCGGMLESGIGRAHNIAMSTLPGFSLPGDVSASQRYWTEDIIEPEVEVSARGTITAPTSPGLGYAVKNDLIDRLAVRSKIWNDGVRVSA